MTIFLYSYQKNIIKIISDELETLGHKCVIFSNQVNFFNSFLNKDNPPDLIAMDYTAWNHDIFPFYNFLKEQRFFQPFIFYNDPCLIAPTRSEHWMKMLDILFTLFPVRDRKIEDKLKNRYIQVFDDFDKIIESKGLVNYVPLMQKSEPLPETLPLFNTYQYLNRNILNKESIYEFQKRVNLPNNLLFLLRIFSENLDKIVTGEQILEYYKQNNKEINKKSLSVLISNLKKYIKSDTKNKYILLSENNGYLFKILE